MFGSQGDINSIIEIKNNLLYSSRPSFPELNKSKYTFVNPVFDEGISRKSFSVMNKVPDFKLESKSRFFHTKDKEQPSFKLNSKEKDKETLYKTRSNSNLKSYQSIESSVVVKKEMAKPKVLLDHGDLEKLIL